MPQRTDAIVGLDDLLAAGLDLQNEDSTRNALANLGEIEPNLAAYLDREIVQIAGKLALAGATPALCREMATTMLRSC